MRWGGAGALGDPKSSQVVKMDNWLDFDPPTRPPKESNIISDGILKFFSLGLFHVFQKRCILESKQKIR